MTDPIFIILFSQLSTIRCYSTQLLFETATIQSGSDIGPHNNEFCSLKRGLNTSRKKYRPGQFAHTEGTFLLFINFVRVERPVYAMI